MHIDPIGLNDAEREATRERDHFEKYPDSTAPAEMSFDPQIVLDLIAHYRETTEDVQHG